jgi:hypothetical protein
MKARIPPKRILNNQQRKACIEYCDQIQDANNLRFFKVIAYILNCDFKFGAGKISKLVDSVETLIKEHKDDEVFWEHIDRDLHKIGLDFQDEEYEDIIGIWKERNNIE